MPNDTIETFGHSAIQHGKANDRIYLMKAAAEDMPGLPAELKRLADEKGYGKIFCKVPASLADGFLAGGYVQEAAIPMFFQGREEAKFLSCFPDAARAESADMPRFQEILGIARAKQSAEPVALDPRFTVRPCTEADADRMAEIYKEVFETYPFPIHDPAYLVETMRSHVFYFGVETDGELIALSSAESDIASLSVEMTDFATLPSWRGHSLANALLADMETAMAAKGFRTAFTIARAISPGMNITFARGSYTHGGILVNNTWISGAIESMNVWHKALPSTGVEA